MNLQFTKMHGLGNDFVLINGLNTTIELGSEQIRFIADRRLGIGCDQVLMIEASQSAEADIRYRIFNADGAEVEQCGNGVRCVGEYLRRHSLIEAETIRVATQGGLVTIHFEDENLIRVDMGIPSFEPEKIPLALTQRQERYRLTMASGEFEVMALSMGNPHAVLLVKDIEQAEVLHIGAEIQGNTMFPESVNVGFMEIIDERHIRLRVNERGVGETQACGTGACAAVAAGIIAGKLGRDVDVELHGGSLSISWAGEGQTLWMTGPATNVYEGQIEI
jgi:diaminopimelate epimerase